MIKKFMVLVISIGVCVSSVYADDLKNSLSNMLNEKEKTPSMIDLGNINLDPKAKSVQQVRKTRSGKAVVATVNGHKIIKKEADTYLKQRTQGKVTDFDHLPPEQRTRLIQELSLPVVIANAAKKELSEEEKQAVYTRMWMQREARKMTVTDDQVMGVYNQLKQQAQENNATNTIPSFERVKDKLKMQLIEQMLIERLIQDAEIKIL